MLAISKLPPLVIVATIRSPGKLALLAMRESPELAAVAIMVLLQLGNRPLMWRPLHSAIAAIFPPEYGTMYGLITMQYRVVVPVATMAAGLRARMLII
jgi:hypothetical protein